MRPLLAILLCAFIQVVNAHTIESSIDELFVANSSDRNRAAELIKELDSKWTEFESDDVRTLYLIQKIYFYILNNQPLQAKKHIEEILLYEDLKPARKVLALNHLSQIEMEQANYRQAFDAIYQSIELLHLVQNNSYKFNYYYSSANIFKETGFFEQALSYAKQSLEIALNESSAEEECYAKSLELSIRNKLNDDTLKTNDFQDTLLKCRPLKLNLIESNLLKNLGILEARRLNFPSARNSLKRALAAQKLSPYLPEKNEAELELAKIYTKELDVSSSSVLINNIINESQNLKLLKEAYIISAENNKLLGNILEQNDDLGKIIDLNRKIQSNELSKNLAFQQVKFAQLSQESQVKILDQENQLLKVNSEAQEKSKQTYQLFSIIAAVLLGIILALTFKFKKQKERYQELSRRDGLTGLFSRRHTLNLATEIHNHSLAKKIQYSVIVFDLDYFKSINDKFGHAIGDWALKEISSKVTSKIRNNDVFGRLGGEEFILILPNTDNKDAKQLAERCLDVIKTVRHEVFNNGFKVTASFGIATYPEANHLEELIQKADDAMYKAKQLGRNQVFSFS